MGWWIFTSKCTKAECPRLSFPIPFFLTYYPIAKSLACQDDTLLVEPRGIYTVQALLDNADVLLGSYFLAQLRTAVARGHAAYARRSPHCRKIAIILTLMIGL